MAVIFDDDHTDFEVVFTAAQKSSPLDTVLTKPVAPPAPPLYMCTAPLANRKNPPGTMCAFHAIATATA
jgi:hypothetical protein